MKESSAKYQGSSLTKHMVVLNKQNFRAHNNSKDYFGAKLRILREITRESIVNLVLSPHNTFKLNIYV